MDLFILLNLMSLIIQVQKSLVIDFNIGKVVDENVNTNISNFESKRRISPILLENSKNNIPVLENDIIMTEPIVVKKEIEKKLICCKLEQFNDDIYLLWENKFYENSCQVTLQMEDQYIFSNKFEGKMIRIFACNNFFYAFYDTLNLINVYTLLNNIVIIDYLDILKHIR